ncbi:hypothetical protein KKD80_01190 [Patescibacteria group bacterium]|nr:hypothetical protein [Patescibacteria group bacterium]
MKKIIVFAVIILVVAGISFFAWQNFTKQTDSFDQQALSLYNEYSKLQEENVRLSMYGYENYNTEQMLDQMKVVRDGAQKVYDLFIDLQKQAEKIENNFLVRLKLVKPVFAEQTYRQKYGLVGAILSKVPVVGKLVDGFDTVHESARLGIYKAYQNCSEVDRDILDAELKKNGINSIDEIFTCNFVKVDNITREASSLEEGLGDLFIEEVSLAKAAAEMGKAGTLAYVDGILAATGVQSVEPDVLPGDLEDFLKIMLDKETVTEYLKSKAISTGFEILHESVDPAAESPSDDDAEIIIATAQEVQIAIYGVLAGEIDSAELTKNDPRTGLIAGQIQPYDQWTVKEKRAVAEKLNELEKNKTLMTMAKTTTGSAQVSVSAGDYEVIDIVENAVPVVNKEVKIDQGMITSIVNMFARIEELRKNPVLVQEIFEKSQVYEPGEEAVLREIIEFDPSIFDLSGSLFVQPTTFSIEEDSRLHKKVGSGTIGLSIFSSNISGKINLDVWDYWQCPENDDPEIVATCVDSEGNIYDAGSWVKGYPVDISGGDVTGTYNQKNGQIEAWLGQHAFTGIFKDGRASGSFYYELPNKQRFLYWTAEVSQKSIL